MSSGSDWPVEEDASLEAGSSMEAFDDQEAWREAFEAIGALGFPGIVSVLGLGLWLAWVWFALNGDIPLFGGGTYDMVAPFLAFGVFGITMLAMAMVPQARRPVMTRRGALTASLLATLGCVTLWVESSGLLPYGAAYVASAICGGSAAMLLFLFGLSYSRLDVGPSVVAYVAASLTAFVGYFFLTGLGEIAGYVLFAAFPLVIAATLMMDMPTITAMGASGLGERRLARVTGRMFKATRTGMDRHEGEGRDGERAVSVGYKRLCLAMAVFFGAVSFTHAMAPIEEHGFASDAGIVLTTFIGLVLLLIYVTRRGTFKILKVCYVASVLLIIFANTVAPFTDDDNLALEAVRNASYLVLFMVVWILLSWVASYGETPPATVWGLAFAGVGVAMAVAWAVGVSIHLHYGDARDAFTMGVGFVVLAFFSFGFNVRDFPKLVIHGSRADSSDGLPGPRVSDDSLAGGSRHAVGSSRSSHESDHNSDVADRTAGLARPPLSDEWSGDRAAVCARPDDRAGESPCAEDGPTASHGDGMWRFPEGGDLVQELRRSRVGELADECGLSPREAEVLEYLAQGYGGERIAEELVISYHTVRAHVRSIYKKLGVHSREGLLDRMRGKG